MGGGSEEALTLPAHFNTLDPAMQKEAERIHDEAVLNKSCAATYRSPASLGWAL